MAKEIKETKASEAAATVAHSTGHVIQTAGHTNDATGDAPKHHTVSAHGQALATITISYPKNHEGTRLFEDGAERTVSAETAKELVDAGIATYKK